MSQRAPLRAVDRAIQIGGSTDQSAPLRSNRLGDRFFQAMIDVFSENARGYSGWADRHVRPLKAGGARDVERPRQLLEMGLSANVTEKTDIIGRLRDLDDES